MKRPLLLALVAPCLAVPWPAAASERLAITGYLQPRFGVRYVPEAVPRDRWDSGLEGSVAGIELSGVPVEQFTYRVHFIVGESPVEAVDSVTATDTNNDGNTDDVSTTTSRVRGISIEEASVSWQPHPAFEVKSGQMRIPFTAQHQSPATALLFRTRSAPNEVFLSGTDLGVLLAYHPESGIAGVSAGVFNGDLLSEEPENEKGIVYAFRADLQPLGSFPFGESDRARGPFRVGVGGGALYHPTVVFDDAGFGGRRVDDIRGSASLRMAFRGAILQTEVLRRQVVDPLFDRPEISSGAYGQGAFLFPFGVEPAARVGYTIENETTSPRRINYVEAGLSWYPHPGDQRIDSLKVSAQYQGEDRVTEKEVAHGFSLGVQLVW